MKIIKNIILAFVSIILALAASSIFIDVFHGFFSYIYGTDSIGSQGIAEFLLATVVSYILFLVLIFTAFGDSKKYWWIGILLIPAVIFEFAFDFNHIYIPIVLGLIGWGVGFGISKLHK